MYSYNEIKFIVIFRLVSAFSSDNRRPKEYGAPIGINEISVGTTVTNSSFSCSFRRPMQVEKEGKFFDLSSESFYIIVAAGAQSRNGFTLE